MAKLKRILVHGAVEGLIDEAVLRRLVLEAGGKPGTIFGKEGKSFIKKRIVGYNRAAEFEPWVVLIDLDHDAECAATVANSWLPYPASHMCFRIAVREIEAWLLADSERLARFLGIRRSAVPKDPETLDDAKGAMIEIARSSRRQRIVKDMVPRSGSKRKIGPAYNYRLIQFVTGPTNTWRPDVAAQSSDSLNRCMFRLEQLVREFA
jgi:hypothetical protein